MLLGITEADVASAVRSMGALANSEGTLSRARSKRPSAGIVLGYLVLRLG
jgi:hypothetical protein